MYCGTFNCYKILEVESDADQTTIKKAFRKMSKKFHPDIARAKGKEDTTEVF